MDERKKKKKKKLFFNHLQCYCRLLQVRKDHVILELRQCAYYVQKTESTELLDLWSMDQSQFAPCTSEVKETEQSAFESDPTKCRTDPTWLSFYRDRISFNESWTDLEEGLLFGDHRSVSPFAQRCRSILQMKASCRIKWFHIYHYFRNVEHLRI